MAYDDVEKWLKKLEELEPADGRLTPDILSKAGDLPVPAAEIREIPLAGVKAFVRVVLEGRTARYDNDAYEAARLGKSGEAKRITARLDYWSSVARWVEELV
jgi:hypothetical protein